MKTLNGQDVAAMTDHWVDTPAHGYLGSSYGQNFKSFLQQPQTVVAANSFIQKLRTDVEILQVLSPEAVSLNAASSGVDRTVVILSVLGRDFDLGTN